MNVIFLDIDGVLNCETTTPSFGTSAYHTIWIIDPILVKRFNRILENVKDTIVVLSSSWRYAVVSKHIDINRLLKEQGYKGDPITERTVVDAERMDNKGIERGEEIQMWLNDHPEVTNFVIFDDDDDMVHLMPHLIQTTFEHGLLDEHIDEAIKRLNN